MPYRAEQEFTCARILGLLVLDTDRCRTALHSGNGFIAGSPSNRRFIYVQWVGRADRQTSIVVEVTARVLPNRSTELLSIQDLFQK
jgi:hypothetical protein